MITKRNKELAAKRKKNNLVTKSCMEKKKAIDSHISLYL